MKKIEWEVEICVARTEEARDEDDLEENGDKSFGFDGIEGRRDVKSSKQEHRARESVEQYGNGVSNVAEMAREN